MLAWRLSKMESPLKLKQTLQTTRYLQFYDRVAALSHLCLVHYILARNITLLSRKKPPPSSKPFDVGRIYWKADTSRSLIRERSRLCSTNVRGKIKNTKILSWQLELSQLSYDIRPKPGAENVVPDAFSRLCASTSNATLRDLYQSLRHPGFARLYHFVRQRNLPLLRWSNINEIALWSVMIVSVVWIALNLLR